MRSDDDLAALRTIAVFLAFMSIGAAFLFFAHGMIGAGLGAAIGYLVLAAVVWVLEDV